jgi:hypothetical protein
MESSLKASVLRTLMAGEKAILWKCIACNYTKTIESGWNYSFHARFTVGKVPSQDN